MTIDTNNPANAGTTARPVIQVRSISAAVHLSKPKLVHETSAAATEPVGAPPVRFPRRRLLYHPDWLGVPYGPLAHPSCASGAVNHETQSGQQPAVFSRLSRQGRNHHNFNEHPRSPKVRGEASPHRRICRIDPFIPNRIVFFEQTHVSDPNLGA
jgi:hypothetical protein